jgi:hypothetical protein
LGVQRVHDDGIRVLRSSALCAALALALLAASPPLSSAVYQCKAADGATVFSDSPCGADAKLIIVRPQALMSNTPLVTKRASSAANRARRGNTNDGDALKCQAREYGAWYQSQNPKPSREQSDEKMTQIVNSCWLATHILSAQDNVTVSPNVTTVIHKAPQAIVGSAGATSAPAGTAPP